MNQQIEEFLNTATEGLRDDTELRMDARAELAVHAEEKLQELTADGKDDATAIQETLKSLGDPIELATGFFDANRRRMKLRAQLRIFMRFALIPVAICSAVWTADLDFLKMFFIDQGEITNRVEKFVARRTNLSDKDRLLLFGDLSRTNKAEQQKAIWEADPTNRMFFANYFFTAVENGSRNNSNIHLSPELLATARKVDPDNALYVYLEAFQEMMLLREKRGVELTNNSTFNVEWDRKKEEENKFGLVSYKVLDRARLDRAMALFEQALKMPYCHTYSLAMSALRAEQLPPHNRLTECLINVSIIIDGVYARLFLSTDLVKIMIAYGDLLLREGDLERAKLFLGGWETVMRQYNSEKDSLVYTSPLSWIAVSYSQGAVHCYRAAGKSEEVERMATRAELASVPYEKLLKESKLYSDNNRKLTKTYGGLLTQGYNPMPLTAIELTPSRLLEYTVVTEMILGTVSTILLLVILGCVIVSLRWRFSLRGQAIPVLLVPRGDTLLKILFFSVVVPGTLFLLATRLAPWSGHEYSMQAGWHKLLAEFGLLIITLLTLPALFGARTVRRRCQELGIPTTRFAARRLFPVILILAAGLTVIWFIPVQSLSYHYDVGIILLSWAGITGIPLLTMALIGFVQGLRGNNQYGLFYGTFFRSLIPVLAGAILLINLAVQPILRASETKYLADSPLSSPCQFLDYRSVMNVSEQLQSDIRKALQKLESMP